MVGRPITEVVVDCESYNHVYFPSEKTKMRDSNCVIFTIML